MSLILKEKLKGPAVWSGSALAGDTYWIHELSDDEIAALDNTLSAVKAAK